MISILLYCINQYVYQYSNIADVPPSNTVLMVMVSGLSLALSVENNSPVNLLVSCYIPTPACLSPLLAARLIVFLLRSMS